ncbi:MAG: SCO family protein [Alsobacter sp.]
MRARPPGVLAAALVAAAAICAGAHAGPAQQQGPAPPTPAVAADPLAGRFGGPFSLLAQDGRRVTERDVAGRFVLVAFGYTHCPDVCPTDLMAMAKALEALGPAGERILPVFITVDPARDTPAVLAEYVASFHPRMLGLTGTEAEVSAAAKAWKVHRRKVLPAPGAQDYLVDHGSLIYLMGPDGRFLTLFPAGTSGETMAAAVKRYLD